MDTFGNLDDWAEVLKTLENLKKKKRLDKHQSGLARILKYGQNWRLLETVLDYAKEIVEPSEEFLTALGNVMMNRNVYLDARILAVDALESLIPKVSTDHMGNNEAKCSRIIGRMKEILGSMTEPLRFQETVIRSLKVIANEQGPEMSKQS
jgi:hypothetical protein